MALALYRKYRPATFSEVVGQEHVTEPLRTALAAGRINHAYLFSGPRGCGKTSSARILARSLNCVHGPTPDPCGECPSCIALAPEGPGSLDVVELDAASHGGVDDTRDLRDKAFYMPAESRYRVFIIDEAHMVTTQGFNALLKIVEEPPEHLVFIFATTEPDKVLTTIRSRTHHYPFRLIPPTTLRALLERLCAEEGAVVEPAVLPLVIRAGGGSARDSLSVLDQLLAGAGPEGVTYRSAVALLGVTDAALIDEVVDALAAGDGASVFGAVDRVVEAGHDPRRFAADLLERLRDLVILNAVPDAVAKGLIDSPEDELAAMVGQADRLGVATLTRMAEVLHTGLVDMRGTTSPRLVLELLCARMLLPGSAAGDASLLQRLERMERRMDIAAEHATQDAGAPARMAPEVGSPTAGIQRGPARPGVPAARRENTAGDEGSDSAAPTERRPANGSARQAPTRPTGRSAAADHAPPTPASTPTQARRAGPDLGLPVPPTLSTSRRGAEHATATPPPDGGTGRDRVAASSSQSAGTAHTDSATAGTATAGALRADIANLGTAHAGGGSPGDGSPVADRPVGDRPSVGRPTGEPTSSAPADSATVHSATAHSVTAHSVTAQSAAAETPDAANGPAHPDPGASSGAGPAARRPTDTEPARPRVDVPPGEVSPTDAATIGVTDVRRVWAEVLAAVKERRRTTQILLESATVVAVESGVLQLTMPSAGTARRVLEPANADLLRGAVKHVLGVDWSIACSTASSAPDGGVGRRPAAAPAGLGQSAGGAFPTGGAEPVPPPPDDDIPDDYGEPVDPAAVAELRDPQETAIALLSAQLGARPLDPQA